MALPLPSAEQGMRSASPVRSRSCRNAGRADCICLFCGMLAHEAWSGSMAL